jgi:drug/metabolite transporter (DMT)-like permease
MSARDWFWIVLLGAIWGCSFVFNAVMIREIGPLWVSALRITIGAAGCWVVVAALRRPVPRQPGLCVRLGLLGVLSYAIPFALFPLAQASVASGVAAIVNAMTPLTTVVVAHFWINGEKASGIKLVGVLFGLAGVGVLTIPTFAAGGTSSLFGILLCLTATVCYALSLNITRMFQHIEPTVFAAIALTGSAVFAIPAAFAFEGAPVMTRPETYAAALAIGLVSTAFTFQIMYRILPRVGATNFATTTFIAPISAVIIGVTVLDETVHPIQLVGMLLVFAGLLLIDGRIRRMLSPRQPA